MPETYRWTLFDKCITLGGVLIRWVEFAWERERVSIARHLCPPSALVLWKSILVGNNKFYFLLQIFFFLKKPRSFATTIYHKTAYLFYYIQIFLAFTMEWHDNCENSLWKEKGKSGLRVSTDGQESLPWRKNSFVLLSEQMRIRERMSNFQF